MIGGWYTLDDDERPVLMGDLPTFGFKALEVWPPLKTKVDGYEVSTVFLGLDHQYGFGEQGDPVLWETMIFGEGPVPWASGDDSEYQERYTSAADARAGHEQTVQRLHAKIAEMTTTQPPAPTGAEMTTAREIIETFLEQPGILAGTDREATEVERRFLVTGDDGYAAGILSALAKAGMVIVERKHIVSLRNELARCGLFGLVDSITAITGDSE